MLGAGREVDAVALAQCIEAVGAGRMAAARKDERVDHAIEGQRRPTRARKLGVDEGNVEGGVVGDQRRLVDELEELVDDVLEERLVLQEIAGQAVHRHGVAVDVALGIEIAMELAAGRDAVDDLDAAELDQPIARWRGRAPWSPCR